jgi:O-succinylbenzoic acid--CoA ligase
MASARGFQDFFGAVQVNSCCVLPLYHVSGLMQFLRSLISGGQFAVLPFKTLEPGNFLPIQQTDFFLSLVPTQLDRLLKAGYADWLRQFQTVLLGGAPAGEYLLKVARQAGIQLAPTYGMTETAAQVATLKPADFLKQRTGYRVLPHAQVTICNAAGDRLAPNQVGNVLIQAKSLAIGYLQTTDELRHDPAIGWTDDLGYVDAQGGLHIVGRASDKIITGGENVFPIEVEAAIQATGLVQDVAVVGVPDMQWGEAVTALYIPTGVESDELLRTAIQKSLSKFKHPKHWIAVKALPRNAQGKLNRAKLRAIALTTLPIPTAATNALALLTELDADE